MPVTVDDGSTLTRETQALVRIVRFGRSSAPRRMGWM